jgi:hypothetical protein
MTADLTPLIARQKALRREILSSALVLLAVAVGVIAFLGMTAKGGITMFFLFGGWTRMVRARWQRYVRAQTELERASRTLAQERARLRGSGERRDAAQGLAISEELPGGELSVGQDGELSERK